MRDHASWLPLATGLSSRNLGHTFLRDCINHNEQLSSQCGNGWDSTPPLIFRYSILRLVRAHPPCQTPRVKPDRRTEDEDANTASIIASFIPFPPSSSNCSTSTMAATPPATASLSSPARTPRRACPPSSPCESSRSTTRRRYSSTTRASACTPGRRSPSRRSTWVSDSNPLSHPKTLRRAALS